MKKRIVWTEVEKKKIVERAVEILREYPSMPVFRAVGEAQEALLPAARRRGWLTKATLGPLAQQIQSELNRPVQNRIKMATGTDDPAGQQIKLAYDYATRLEVEMISRAQAAGLELPTFEILLILWTANFRAYMEARHDKL